jgi:hypothetical protein
VRAKYTKVELERAEALEKAFARENIATRDKLAALDAAHRAEARALQAEAALTKVRNQAHTPPPQARCSLHRSWHTPSLSLSGPTHRHPKLGVASIDPGTRPLSLSRGPHTATPSSV